MNRIKALYRGWGIPCAGTQVYAPRYREEWLHKIEHAGVRRRAELLYQQLDGLQTLRRTLRPELLAESRKHKASKLLRQIPCIGPIRAARLLALMQTPHRFRSKRQLWNARVRGRVSMHSLGASCAAAGSTESPGQSYAPSDNPKKP
jgi:transposase